MDNVSTPPGILPKHSSAQKIWVVIPTLNEAETIQGIIQNCQHYCDTVLVIDGGSTDGTAKIAEQSGARVEIYPQRGKGLALRRALEIVPTEVTVFIDADGSHDPAEIPSIADPVSNGQADMIVGSRWTGGSDELHGDMNKWLRRSGSRVLTTLVNLRFRGQMSDIQNGFRALRTQIGRDIGLQADDFTIEQEMVMKFLAGGFRVWNVPSHEYARQGGEAKLDLGRVWFRFGMVALSHLIGLSRPAVRKSKLPR